MREYNVVKVKMRSMGFMLNEAVLAQILNEQAAAGWIFDKGLESQTQLMRAGVYLLVFYREKK